MKLLFIRAKLLGAARVIEVTSPLGASLGANLATRFLENPQSPLTAKLVH